MKYKSLFLFFFLFLHIVNVIYSQQKSLLGDRIVSREEYEAALPYAIGDAVSFRDFPSIVDGKVLAKIKRGTIFDISAVTEEKDIVFGDSYPWYEISIRHDTNSLGHGWIYGKYIGFREGYEAIFWNLEVIPASLLKRNRYTKQLLSSYMNTDDNNISFKWLAEKKLYSIEKPGIWYLDEYELHNYKTDFGDASILINEDTKEYKINYFIIRKPNDKLILNIGDNIEKLNELFGTDYSIKDDLLLYDLKMLYSFFGLNIKLNNNIIDYIECFYAFD
jgi:hypothetical protein